MTERDHIRRAVSAMGALVELQRALGRPTPTAEQLRAKLPGLAAIEQSMPGITAMVVGAASGDAESERKLGAILRCQEPPSPITH